MEHPHLLRPFHGSGPIRCSCPRVRSRPIAVSVALASARAQFSTTRLWGVGSTPPYLHDGRATDLDSAIRLHGGEGATARNAYLALAEDQRGKLLDFLSSLVLERGTGLQTAPPGVTGY